MGKSAGLAAVDRAAAARQDPPEGRQQKFLRPRLPDAAIGSPLLDPALRDRSRTKTIMVDITLQVDDKPAKRRRAGVRETFWKPSRSIAIPPSHPRRQPACSSRLAPQSHHGRVFDVCAVENQGCRGHMGNVALRWTSTSPLEQHFRGLGLTTTTDC